MLYYRSETTDGAWRIYSDNIAMARWLQDTVQGMLEAELADTSIPITDAAFDKSGDPAYFWTETIMTADEEISMTWARSRRPAPGPHHAGRDSRAALRRLHRPDPRRRHAAGP